MPITRSEADAKGNTFRVINTKEYWHKWPLGTIVKRNPAGDDAGLARQGKLNFKAVTKGVSTTTQYLKLSQLELVPAKAKPTKGITRRQLLKKGAKFVVVKHGGLFGNGLPVGSVIQLRYDDSTEAPRFETLDGAETGYMRLDNLRLATKKDLPTPPKSGITKAQFNTPGAVFVVTEPSGSAFVKGDRVVKEYDDGSSCPNFRRLHDDKIQYHMLSAVTLEVVAPAASPKKQTKKVGITREQLNMPGAVFLSTENEERRFPIGTQFVLEHDDGTDLPYFKKVSNGERHCIFLNDLIMEEATPAPVSKPKVAAPSFTIIEPTSPTAIPMKDMKVGEWAVITGPAYTGYLVMRPAPTSGHGAFIAYNNTGKGIFIDGFNSSCPNMVRLLPKGSKITINI